MLSHAPTCAVPYALRVVSVLSADESRGRQRRPRPARSLPLRRRPCYDRRDAQPRLPDRSLKSRRTKRVRAASVASTVFLVQCVYGVIDSPRCSSTFEGSTFSTEATSSLIRLTTMSRRGVSSAIVFNNCMTSKLGCQLFWSVSGEHCVPETLKRQFRFRSRSESL